MQKITAKFNIFFLIFIFISIVFNFYFQISIYLLVLFTHEYIHRFVAKKLGYMLNNMVFLPYGAYVGGSNLKIVDKHELLISISAPLFNILVSIIIVALWWVFPFTYESTYILMNANFALGFFNLLPIFPLDGGRVILTLFRNKKINKKINYFLIFNSVLFALVFISLFIISIFNNINFNYFFISFFLTLSIFDFNRNKFYNKTLIEKNYKNVKILPKKNIIVNENIKLNKLVKYLNIDTYIEFQFIDNKGRIIKTLNESELIKILKK